jgi:bifunctional non-homologous end joining protein LigD
MSGTNRFIIHKHHTSHPHYDLIIDTGGILKSWVIPKSLPTVTKEKRLAIQDKDMESGIIHTKGVINDAYGVGEAEIWDSGSYELREKRNSKIVFETQGSKFYGRFVLLLPSWGKFSKKRLWVLFASSSMR